MEPDNNMSRVVNGRRYTVKTAKLLADNAYWMSQSFEIDRNDTFLYRTPKGYFFRVNVSNNGKQDTFIPLSRDEAISLYQELNDPDAIPFDEAFN